MIFDTKKTISAEVLGNEDSINTNGGITVIKADDNKNNENTVTVQPKQVLLDDPIVPPVVPPVDIADNPFYLNNDAILHVHVRHTF